MAQFGKLTLAGTATTAASIITAVIAGTTEFSIKSHSALAYNALGVIACVGVAIIVADFLIHRKDSEQAKAPKPSA